MHKKKLEKIDFTVKSISIIIKISFGFDRRQIVVKPTTSSVKTEASKIFELILVILKFNKGPVQKIFPKKSKNHPHWFCSESSEDSKTVSGLSVRPLLSSQWFFKVGRRSTEISYFRAQLSFTNYRSRIKCRQNTLLRLAKLFKFHKTKWKRFQSNIKIQNYAWRPFCLKDVSTQE